MEKIEFSIKVREIGKGFIVVIANKHDDKWEEIYCLDMWQINEAVKKWTKKIEEKREKEEEI